MLSIATLTQSSIDEHLHQKQRRKEEEAEHSTPSTKVQYISTVDNQSMHAHLNHHHQMNVFARLKPPRLRLNSFAPIPTEEEKKKGAK